MEKISHPKMDLKNTWNKFYLVPIFIDLRKDIYKIFMSQMTLTKAVLIKYDKLEPRA